MSQQLHCFTKRTKTCLRRWSARSRVRCQTRWAASTRSQIKIILGSGGTRIAGWIATDIDSLNILDTSDWAALFNEETVDAMLAEHVWEHLTIEQASTAAANCFRYLRPSGHLRIAVPDGFHPDPTYIAKVKPGGSGPGAHDHKLLYTHETLAAMLGSVGFQIRRLEYFDRDKQFQTIPWTTDGGRITRSSATDPRNHSGTLAYTSIIIDAIKPTEPAAKTPPPEL